ncbi:aminoacyl-tRNA hydrolase [Aspergillus lucknowensis]|uniref:Peptidyl-tRNA hydrolase n=1 Tax=Aspergillus lucknowensis TaxID=176173 RepID=A0ABR4LQ80_9EURO
MASRKPFRSLFIASIGNPGRYRSTRHSAGHILLDAIAPLLRAELPPLYKTWYSPSLMNESGIKLSRELESFKRLDHQGTTRSALVILHDELEAPLGKLVVKGGGAEKASPRGHRGLRDIFKRLENKRLYPQVSGFTGTVGNPTLSILRIGVGIGRPRSRSPEDVSEYVLTKMDVRELDAIKKAAVPVVKLLAEQLWGTEKENPTPKSEGQTQPVE